jgi:hypothetical protein
MTLKQVGAQSTVLLTLAIGALMLIILLGILNKQSAEAQTNCPAQDTSRGVVTSTFNVAFGGNYKVWARMSAQSATNDSFILEVDGTNCGIIMGDTSVPTTGWKWLNYRNGSTTNTVSMSLTAGAHSLKLIGREDGVKVDRVMFVPSESTCVPDDATKGSNCLVTIDTAVPQTAITSPTPSQTIGGTFNLQATASDDVGVTKVEFYAGNTLLATDTTSPYSYSLNTTSGSFPNGAYSFTSIAYDAIGNQTRSTAVSANVYNAPVDTTAPTVSITSPVASSTVSGTINVSATATDASGISRVEFSVDGGSPINSDTTSPYGFFYDTTALSKGSHTISAKAFDPAGNSKTVSVTVNVDNSIVSKACDFNADGSVGLIDLSRLLTNYGGTVTANTSGDCDGDGKVGLIDLSKLLSGYGK